jgi:hypothetical protein
MQVDDYQLISEAVDNPEYFPSAVLRIAFGFGWLRSLFVGLSSGHVSPHGDARNVVQDGSRGCHFTLLPAILLHRSFRVHVRHDKRKQVSSLGVVNDWDGFSSQGHDS